MRAEQLTPFPDGTGFLEHGWDSLTRIQRAVLMKKAGLAGPWAGQPNYKTWAILRRYGLIRSKPSVDVTDRGQALAEWAVKTGRWTR